MHQIRAAADVTAASDLWRVIALMVARAAFGAGEPSGYAVDQGGLVHLHQDHMVELPAMLGEHRIERLGLRHRARKAVENKAARTIGLRDAISDHLDDDVIRNQLAGIVDRLYPLAELAAGGDGRTHHVAG